MPEQPRNLSHMYLEGFGQLTPYKRSPGRGPNAIPRDRLAHANHLELALAAAVQAASAQPREALLRGVQQGYYLEFELSGANGNKDVLHSLEDSNNGIELASVHTDVTSKTTFATVMVPDKAQDVFGAKLKAYKTEETKKGAPKNATLVTHIDSIQRAALQSIFVGDPTKLPEPTTLAWWEVWLRRGGVEDFRTLADRTQITVSQRTMVFPEREVVLVHATFDTLSRIFLNSIVMTEVRLSLDTPQFFIDLPNDEQVAWVGNTVSRLQPPVFRTPTSVLLLDTGVNRDHPLIAPYLPSLDCQAWKSAWGGTDMRQYDGHGTAMAGLALHGDLLPVLTATGPIAPTHWLESVKILPPYGINDREQYGLITKDSVRMMEATHPDRWRVMCLAVTAAHDVSRGRPSAWSAAIDQLACGTGGVEDEEPRLVVVAAGNSAPEVKDLVTDYLEFADSSEVHSPAQAWNALTIGAYTEKDQVHDPDFAGWEPVAAVGDLTPTSSTSLTWQDQWPIKPDIVLEGGNVITDGAAQKHAHPDVRLLTTDYKLPQAQFRDFGDTSAAAALGARMAAHLASENPHYWPETVRGLLVHSADWTPAMLAQRTGSKVKGNRQLLRRYGYGVPNLDRARRSAANDWTLVIQDALQVFGASKEAQDSGAQMHLHQFPWSSVNEESLEGLDLEMRITLSYFIDPNPSERGFAQRFRYASHGLRFAVKGALESPEAFKARVQHDKHKEDDGIRDAGNEYWEFGPKSRVAGSIHTDRWRGDIATLRDCDSVLVYPTGGWWSSKKGGKSVNPLRVARYSLIVSLRAPEADIDIYTPIATRLGIGVMVEN